MALQPVDDSKIAEVFVRLFESLQSLPRAGRVLGVELSKVPPKCQPKSLIVMRCDSDDLTLTSIMRKTWVIDETGIRIPTTWPLPRGYYSSEIKLTSPTLKFSTNGSSVRYGLNLGSDWYCTYEAPIASFGDDDDAIKSAFDSTSWL
jgi:hypothetical protein